MKLAVSHLLRFERSGAINWKHSGLTFENGQRPPMGSTLTLHARSGRSYPCKLSGYSGGEAEIQYVGPPLHAHEVQEFVDTLLLGH